ncbi:uncharacterized protein LOC119093185 [Pollicipes pollicipes]|uniref:uncharacterized protein LOC119093185 n=1 Tax=Pollicipes pollicipes TaxID=41117 RepID=UPI001884C2C0|nr:uncharacterized protein LOC119093185 [Pollicipes pollicipes]
MKNLKESEANFGKVKENLDILEIFLGRSAYAAGSQMTVADLALLANVSSLEAAEIDLSAWPKIQAWLSKLKNELPYYAVNDKGAKMLGAAYLKAKAECQANEATRLTLYAVEGSPPCRAVFLTLKAIGLDHNLKIISMQDGEHKTPEFLKMNPQHTVPTMNDNGVHLGESRAITTYVMNKYAPDSKLYPRDAAARALVDSRLYFDHGLFASLKGVLFPLLFMKNLKESEANFGKVKENLDILEIFLGRSAYAAGSQMTVADLALLANVSSLEAAEIDLSAWPKIQAWLSKLKNELPYYAVNDKGAKMLGAAYLKAKAECQANEATRLTLYAVEGSPPCRAVFLTLKAIGLDHNLKTISMQDGEHKTPEFLKMNPLHTVPTMDDNGVHLGESKAIMLYALNKYAPDSKLYPKDPAARAVVDSRLFFDFGFFSSIRGIVFPLVFMKNLKESQANFGKVKENLDALEIFLSRSAYAAGDEMTVADLALLANVSTLDAAGIDLSAWPKIKAWLAKMKDLPYYAVNDKGAKMLGAAYLKAKAECQANEATRLTLYAVEGSPPCRAVFLTLKAIGLDRNLKIISMQDGEHKTPEFLKMNPLHTVPTMDDNGVHLGGSKAIMLYALNKYAPDSKLYPKDPAARAVVDSRLFFDFGFFSSIRGIVFPLLFMKNLKESQANFGKVKENLDALEIFLSRSAYAAGDEMTVADLALLANVSTLDAAGIDLSAWPKIKAWLAKMKDLPYYAVNDKGAKMLGSAYAKAKAECESK